jgi:hypothetical protein
MNMHITSRQHPDGRWGIYQDQALLATIDCQWQCQVLVSELQRRLLEATVTEAAEILETSSQQKSLVA